VPAVPPVTVPRPLMVATDGGLALQLPPGVRSESAVVPPPAHAVNVPVIGEGLGSTVNDDIALLVPIAYVTLTTPAATAVAPFALVAVALIVCAPTSPTWGVHE